MSVPRPPRILSSGILRAAALPIPRTLRFLLLRWCGLRVDTRSIAAGTRFFGPDVTIGRGTYVNTRCLFDSWAPVTLGRRCHVGPGVMFITSSHQLGSSKQRAGDIIPAPIVVGDGCWIGAAALILPGVSIGDGAVVAAGAVVTRDCAPNRLYGGVPARELRVLDDA